MLLDFMLGEGVRGESVIDLGCGAGGFSVELLKKGAANAVGYDLSSEMISVATKLSVENGFESQAKFIVGNAAIEKLPTSDIVIMDKVLCCYSDWRPLLNNAITAGRTMIGFIVPRDDGIAKWPILLGVRVMNFFERRRGNILFYLHPLHLLDRSLRDAGFTKRKRRGSRFWLVFLYSRAQQTITGQSQ